MKVHYAYAQKLKHPHATAKIAGPFETGTEASAAATRLRPLYPDCNTRPGSETVSMKRGAELLGGEKIKEHEHVEG